MHVRNKETNQTQTSSGLLGGKDQITFTLDPTNHRRGREPRDLFKNIECAVISSVELGQWY